jgi:hypothetical protein
MEGHNQCCRDEYVQESKGTVCDLECQASTKQEAQEPRPRAATAQPTIQMGIDTATVAKCMMIKLLMMMIKTPMPVVLQIWTAVINKHFVFDWLGALLYDCDRPGQPAASSRVSTYKAFGYNIGYNIEQSIQKK